MENSTIQILTSGTDPVDALTIVVSTPSVTEERITLAQIKARMLARTDHIAAEEQRQVDDQALLDRYTGIFTAAGVLDTSQPLTTDQDAAIQKQNDAANVVAVQSTIDAASSQLDTLTKASPAQPAPLTP
jgi:hypothetical protein